MPIAAVLWQCSYSKSVCVNHFCDIAVLKYVFRRRRMLKDLLAEDTGTVKIRRTVAVSHLSLFAISQTHFISQQPFW